MLVRFFLVLREAGVPVTVGEFLTLLEALKAGLGEARLDRFYYLARTCLVKNERHYDRFDRAFATHLKDIEEVFGLLSNEWPADWLDQIANRYLLDGEKSEKHFLEALDHLVRTLKMCVAEQQSRREGDGKQTDTPEAPALRADGESPQNRIGPARVQKRRTAQVWNQRQFANLDDKVELGTRNMKVALRRLRRFARRGAATEFDLANTIAATARAGGWLNVRMIPARHSIVKVILLLDVGGSMDPYVRICSELFSAARSEFKHLRQYYFHNFTYESLWLDNRRRADDPVSTMEIMHTYSRDYKLILVGDATMNPCEITDTGGSVEHRNLEPGQVWLKRLLQAFPKVAWVNPQPRARWQQTPSIELTGDILGGRMYPLTLSGLDEAMSALT